MAIRTEHVEVDFKLKLKKDLHENEVICDKCGGTGLQVDDYPFGLASDKNFGFPYKKQTIKGCSHCYNGVKKKCEYCGDLLDRRSYRCKCKQNKLKKEQERHAEEMETWEKSSKVTVTQLIQSDYENMLYVENFEQFYTDIDTLLEEISEKLGYEELETKDIEHLRVYKTNKETIGFDAQGIIENATDDLHESVYEDVIKHENELQELLDLFAERVKGLTASYYPDYENGVVITLEDILTGGSEN